MTEREVYRYWIPYVNPNLSYIENINDFTDNNFLLIAGNGYPGYLDRISKAIEDVNNHRGIQRLVLAVDSEEKTFDEKYSEIFEYTHQRNCVADIKIVIQHFCFETWALGNRKIIGKNIQTPKLRDYVTYFNVTKADPELLPAYPVENLTRVRFAFKYLNLALQEKTHSLSYSKRKPHALCNSPYFNELKIRLELTNHIKSFQTFLDAFR